MTKVYSLPTRRGTIITTLQRSGSFWSITCRIRTELEVKRKETTEILEQYVAKRQRNITQRADKSQPDCISGKCCEESDLPEGQVRYRLHTSGRKRTKVKKSYLISTDLHNALGFHRKIFPFLLPNLE